MDKLYQETYDYLSNQFEEINGYDFYMDIFPNNENHGELNTDFSKPNAVYLYQDSKDDNSDRRLRRRIMLADTWEDDYMNFVEENIMTLCGGLSYRGRTNKLEHAQKMNALIIDLDGVGLSEIRNLYLRINLIPGEPFSIPNPTYIVCSGTGLHLYYVLDEPIDLYPNIKIQLKGMKHDLVRRIWDYNGTSRLKEVQYQSINQGFRMVGSVNNKYGNTVTAFRTGERITLADLNVYVKSKVDINKRFKPTKMTREQAKETYPEWYQRVVVEKNRKPKKWDIASKQGYALYDWWLSKVDEAKAGHRYFYLMCLSIYACKCDVPKKKLKKDMQDVFETLKKIEHENDLTQEDVRSALETYDMEYYDTNIESIEHYSAIRIERNKRNGRKRSEHIKLMNYVRDEINGNKDWRNKDGRPTKKEMLVNYLRENPKEKNKSKIASDLGLSRTTVTKWWDEAQEEKEQPYYIKDGHITTKLMSQELSDILIEELNKDS